MIFYCYHFPFAIINKVDSKCDLHVTTNPEEGTI